MKTVKTLLSVLTIFFAVLIIGQTAIAVVPHISGCKCYAVMTNSMYPTLKIGDLIIVKPVEFDEIAVNDLVTFGSSTEKDFVFTHRIVNINRENQTLYTKGDANNAADVAPTPYSYAIGRMIASYPAIGSIGIFIRSDAGMRVLIAVFIMWLIMEIFSFLTRKRKTGGKV